MLRLVRGGWDRDSSAESRQYLQGDVTWPPMVTQGRIGPHPDRSRFPPARSAGRDPQERRRGRRRLAPLIITARPRQWAKNVLVFGAAVVGGALLGPELLIRATLAFVAFCLASSGMYYVNDIVDRQVDQQHPRKRLRRSRRSARGAHGRGRGRAAVRRRPRAGGLGGRSRARRRPARVPAARAGLHVLAARHRPAGCGRGGRAVRHPGSCRWRGRQRVPVELVPDRGLLPALFISAGKRRAEHNDLGHRGAAIGRPSRNTRILPAVHHEQRLDGDDRGLLPLGL